MRLIVLTLSTLSNYQEYLTLQFAPTVYRKVHSFIQGTRINSLVDWRPASVYLVFECLALLSVWVVYRVTLSILQRTSTDLPPVLALTSLGFSLSLSLAGSVCGVYIVPGMTGSTGWWVARPPRAACSVVTSLLTHMYIIYNTQATDQHSSPLPPHTLAVGYVGWSLCDNVFLFCFVLKGSVEGGRGGHQDGDVSGWSVTSCDCTGVLRTALLPTPASLLSPSTQVMIKCPYTVLVLELVNVYVRWTSGNLVIW